VYAGLKGRSVIVHLSAPAGEDRLREANIYVRRCQILQYPAQALARGSTGTLSLPRTLALLLLSVLAPSVPRTVPWREAEDKGHLFIHRPQGYSGLGNEPHTPVKEDNRTSNPQQTRYPGCAVEHAHHANADRGRHKQAQSEVETREGALNGWAWAASCRSTSVRREMPSMEQISVPLRMSCCESIAASFLFVSDSERQGQSGSPRW
jgi:hypothetical protein